ncbi:MAG TPA: HAMP domain-containing sensor histidine kinase [Methylomirabilota bacterium]|nr:HAMP domain-containing sensor histidine kinase [Methylomirabilota bacterium]
MAPAAIVAALGWISLHQWERSAELLRREQARDMAAMAADKVTMALRVAEDRLLARLQATLAARGIDAAALDGLLAGAPLVRRLRLVDASGALLYPRSGAEAERALARRLHDAAGAPAGRRELALDGEDWLTLTLSVRGAGPVLAAIARDPDVLGREVLAGSLAASPATSLLVVLDARGRTVWAQAPLEGAEPLVSVAFRDALPSWRMAVYQPADDAPRAAVRRQVRLFMIAFVALLVVIVAGLVVTWRLMRRETEMARLKSDFVANVSHDLKTPLSVIRMFGETLEMGRLPDEARRREYYRVITREAERLTRLIDNVLDFSRIEGGRRRYDVVPTPVEPLVRETLDAFAYPLAQQGFKVEITVAPDLPEVPMDADAVGQALANLVDNAIKYSADDRVLAVDARVQDGELVLSVADHGVGIPAAEHARIFDKFYRVGASETQGRRGSGVGLSLVRHVAEAHGGRVTVESAPGEGSRFALRLPLEAARA